MIAFDTSATISVIPSASYDGWYDENTDGNCTIDSDAAFVYNVDDWVIDCEMAYTTICQGNDADTSVDSCAYMGFCLTAENSFPDNY